MRKPGLLRIATGSGPAAIRRAACILAAGLVSASALAVVSIVPAAAASPTVTLSPSPPSGGYDDQTTISISVSANSTFTAGAGIHVLECADPGGTTANLPTSDASCDGNTAQGNPVFVGSDGSFSVTGYTVYQLPSVVLAEPSTGLPKCDSSDYCVLYIGQNQNDFTQPYVFSAPFLMSGSEAPTTTTTSTTVVTSSPTTTGATTSTTTGAGGTYTTSSSSTTSAAAPAGSSSGSGGSSSLAGPSSLSTSSSSGTSGSGGSSLAYTGTPAALPWLVIAGIGCVGVGVFGRRFLMTRRRAVKQQP